jgi:hypothetical protein
LTFASPRRGVGFAMDLPPSPYRFQPWRAAWGACLGVAVFAAAQYGALAAAYGWAQGRLAIVAGEPGSSYFADDLASVPARTLSTMLIALPCWGLVHYYGRRGPRMALFYCLVVSWVGFVAMEKWAGPLESPVQFLAFAVPTFLSLMLVWRLAYRRAPTIGQAAARAPAQIGRRGPWQA